MTAINKIINSCIDKPDDFIFGFADLKGIITDTLPRFGLVIGRKLDDAIIDMITEGPTPEYFEHYEAVNIELSELIHKIAAGINETGYQCNPIEPSNDEDEFTKSEQYKLTLRMPVSHKMVATRTGLGWIGKTDLFVSKKFGPRVRLVSLLTDYPFEITGRPINKSRCGKCNICVASCPANAATGQLWDVNTDRDIFFNAHKCSAKCKELTKKRLNLDASTCGICVSVCPLGKIKNDSEK